MLTRVLPGLAVSGILAVTAIHCAESAWLA